MQAAEESKSGDWAVSPVFPVCGQMNWTELSGMWKTILFHIIIRKHFPCAKWWRDFPSDPRVFHVGKLKGGICSGQKRQNARHAAPSQLDDAQRTELISPTVTYWLIWGRSVTQPPLLRSLRSSSCLHGPGGCGPLQHQTKLPPWALSITPYLHHPIVFPSSSSIRPFLCNFLSPHKLWFKILSS